MMRPMGTTPINTAKTYALTAAGACSVTIQQGSKSITWQILPEGGQTTFIVPAGASVSISDPTALISPLPFNVALGAGNGGTGGSTHLTPEDADKLRRIPAGAGTVLTADGQDICTASGTTPELAMTHASWVALSDDTKSVSLAPAGDTEHALQMQLIYTPAATVEEAEHFITAKEGSRALFRWLYGAPPLVAGYTYILTMTQTVLHGQLILLGACSAIIPTPID